MPTYPPPAPTQSGDITSIHTFLQRPDLLARRIRNVALHRFIADALLPGRYTSIGGAIQFEQSSSIFTPRVPEIVRPLTEYPVSPSGIGPTQIAEVKKWGQDVPISDESINRMRLDPVERAFLKVTNHLVKQIDSVALAAISSSITATAAVGLNGAWTAAAKTAENIFLDVQLAKAAIIDLNEGYEPDTIVVTTTVWSHVMAKFGQAGVFPRESGNTPLLTGQFPVIDGLRWLYTPNVPLADAAVVVDSTQLGGMADEALGGPGYTGQLAGIETKAIRLDSKDGYLLRARRATVPIVIEPDAGYEITGVS